MPATRLYLTDRRRELSLLGDPETFVRLLAAATADPGTIEDLLHEASYYDETVGPEILRQAEDTTVRTADLRIDVVNKRIVYNSDLVTFGRRGVLPLVTGRGPDPTNLRTYAIPLDWELYDTFLARPVDDKSSLRREKDLWSDAVGNISGGNVEPRKQVLTIDGLNLGASDVQDIVLWTKTEDDRPPTVNGKSVYEFRLLAGGSPRSHSTRHA